MTTMTGMRTENGDGIILSLRRTATAEGGRTGTITVLVTGTGTFLHVPHTAAAGELRSQMPIIADPTILSISSLPDTTAAEQILSQLPNITAAAILTVPFHPTAAAGQTHSHLATTATTAILDLPSAPAAERTHSHLTVTTVSAIHTIPHIIAAPPTHTIASLPAACTAGTASQANTTSTTISMTILRLLDIVVPQESPTQAPITALTGSRAGKRTVKSPGAPTKPSRPANSQDAGTDPDGARAGSGGLYAHSLGTR